MHTWQRVLDQGHHFQDISQGPVKFVLLESSDGVDPSHDLLLIIMWRGQPLSVLGLKIMSGTIVRDCVWLQPLDGFPPAA